MPAKKCPDCGSQHFYVKDPDDQYNIFEFDLRDGEILPSDTEDELTLQEVQEETEVFCDHCAWHDKFNTLK